MQKSLLFTVSILAGFCFSNKVEAQRKISLNEAEKLFKERNAELIVTTQKEIIEADAAVKEAKLFNNPELTIEQVNLWSNSHQREGEKEVVPPLFGKFGRNTQFSVEVSQEIRLGGERRKQIRKEKSNRKVVALENLETTLDMVQEFKEAIFEINYAREYGKLLSDQKSIYDTIISNYKKQLEKGYISPTELLRMQAESLQIEQELNETQRTINSGAETIQSMLGYDLSEPVEVIINEEDMRVENGLDYLFNLLYESNPQLLKSKAEIEAQQHNLKYERSVRIPNMTLSVNYDRFGGIWKDFIGFGVSFDLPVFNRNQASTKAAKQLSQLATYDYEQKQIKLRNKLQTTVANYNYALTFVQRLENEPIIKELDSLLDKYQTNMLKKNISLLEFIDFMETYKDTKNILLEAEKELYTQYSLLESTIGLKLN